MLILQSGSPPNKSPGQNFCQFTPSRPTEQRFACCAYRRQQQPCAAPLASRLGLERFALRRLERSCARPGQRPTQPKERRIHTSHMPILDMRAPRASSWCDLRSPRATLARTSASPTPLHCAHIYSAHTLAPHAPLERMHTYNTCTLASYTHSLLSLLGSIPAPSQLMASARCSARPVSAAYIPNRSPHPGTKFLPR